MVLLYSIFVYLDLLRIVVGVSSMAITCFKLSIVGFVLKNFRFSHLLVNCFRMDNSFAL